MNFMDKFPKIPYDINKGQYSNFDSITDLTFRFSIIKDVLNNIAAYYEYDIREGETPEILADKVYGDPEAYWIILYANDIYDPQYDWPMDKNVFEKYIIGKYGSISAAKSTIHHYEKIIGRQVENSEKIYLDRQIVDYAPISFPTVTIKNTNANTSNLTINQILAQYDDVGQIIYSGSISNLNLSENKIILQPINGEISVNVALSEISTGNIVGTVVETDQKNYDYYLKLPSPAEPEFSLYIVNNKPVIESISRNEVSNYDYELELNEQKRLIKIIKKEYYGQIMNEFVNLTKSTPSFYRKLT